MNAFQKVRNFLVPCSFLVLASLSNFANANTAASAVAAAKAKVPAAVKEVKAAAAKHPFIANWSKLDEKQKGQLIAQCDKDNAKPADAKAGKDAKGKNESPACLMRACGEKEDVAACEKLQVFLNQAKKEVRAMMDKQVEGELTGAELATYREKGKLCDGGNEEACSVQFGMAQKAAYSAQTKMLKQKCEKDKDKASCDLLKAYENAMAAEKANANKKPAAPAAKK
jgi:hypothetical protein